MALTGIGEMGMIAEADPVLRGEEDILIRVSHIGVCGSDMHYYTTGRIGNNRVEYPFVVGHEGSGIVEETGAGVMDVQHALVDSDGDVVSAKKILKKKGLEKAAKKEERETAQGLVETYVHPDGRIGAMVFLACETDFVARTDDFKRLVRELAMQVAAMNPQTTAELLKQEYIREPEKSVKELIAEVIAKTGENIQVRKIARFALGD